MFATFYWMGIKKSKISFERFIYYYFFCHEWSSWTISHLFEICQHLLNFHCRIHINKTFPGLLHIVHVSSSLLFCFSMNIPTTRTKQRCPSRLKICRCCAAAFEKKATAPLPRRFSQKDIATATAPLPRWLFQKPAAAAPPWTSLDHRIIKLLLSSLQNSSCSWLWFKKLTDCKLFDLTIVDWHLVIVYFCMMIVKYFIRILRLTLTCLTSWLLSNHY